MRHTISSRRKLESAVDDAKADREKAEALVAAERAEVRNRIHGTGIMGLCDILGWHSTLMERQLCTGSGCTLAEARAGISLPTRW